jgi:hypothetical protein
MSLPNELTTSHVLSQRALPSARMLRLAVLACLLSAVTSRPLADSRAKSHATTPNTHGAVDCIGYYGNSGLEVGEIPLIGDIDGNYNVIILTFAAISSNGTFSLDGQIQGPCVTSPRRSSRIATNCAPDPPTCLFLSPHNFHGQVR